MVEMALLHLTGKCDLTRVDYAIRQHEQWYRGDGAYGDGREFHWDYYNSFVIQPMLLDIMDMLSRHNADFYYDKIKPRIHARAVRYAQVQERMILLGRFLSSNGPLHSLSLWRFSIAGSGGVA
jgi:hypothetical protein